MQQWHIKERQHSLLHFLTPYSQLSNTQLRNTVVLLSLGSFKRISNEHKVRKEQRKEDKEHGAMYERNHLQMNFNEPFQLLITYFPDLAATKELPSMYFKSIKIPFAHCRIILCKYSFCSFNPLKPPWCVYVCVTCFRNHTTSSLCPQRVFAGFV
jgi:hypothetical protein